MKRKLANVFCLAALAVVMASGCKEKGGTTTPPATEPDPVTSKGPLSTDQAEWKSWRWEGEGDNCFYRHQNQCFATKDAACTAASCGDRKCIDDHGAPAVVSCQEK